MSIKYQIHYPLKKEGIKFDSILTPILSARFSPNKSKDIKEIDSAMEVINEAWKNAGYNLEKLYETCN